MTVRPLLIAAALTTAASPVAAQLPVIFPPGSPIGEVWFPKVFWTSRLGFAFGGYYLVFGKHTYETFDQPPPYQWGVELDGQITTKGSRQLSLKGYAPLVLDGWRFRVALLAQRRNRADYFGIGNDAEFDEANEEIDELFYRARHLRTVARAQVQRRIVGGLRALGGFHVERWRLEPLTTTSQLGLDLAAGVDPTIGRGVTDIAGRVGLVFDTRDDEAVPRRGVFLEAIHAWGEADDDTYTRTLVSARGYLPVSQRLAVTGRVAGQRMGGTPRLGSLYLVEVSGEPFRALGGPESHRGLMRDRLIGRHKLFVNLDVFYILFELPTLVSVKLVGFLDAGRVFAGAGEEFRITTDDLAVGGGGGLMLHMFRNGVLGLTGAAGPDGLVLHAYTSWPY